MTTLLARFRRPAVLSALILLIFYYLLAVASTTFADPVFWIAIALWATSYFLLTPIVGRRYETARHGTAIEAIGLSTLSLVPLVVFALLLQLARHLTILIPLVYSPIIGPLTGIAARDAYEMLAYHIEK